MKSPFGPRRDVTSDLGERIDALHRAVELSRGRADEQVLERASAVVDRADDRLSFSGSNTVVALAGATGSGKSSLFNALVGADLAQAGVRRPTTARAMAACFGDEVPNRLLDWLDVPVRTLVAGTKELDGLVLLDLPDHDSIEEDHRLEAERLVSLVDALVWVVDPQKYADDALHNRYLAPMAPYATVMIIAFNQADRLDDEGLHRATADLRQLLDAEGLADTPLLDTSAATGAGVADLKQQLADVVKAKKVAVHRISTDVAEAAAGLKDQLGPDVSTTLDQRHVDDLVDSFARAAGVQVVGDAVADSTRRRGSAATGWPLVSWISRLRPDPLKRLHLDLPSLRRAGHPRPEEISPASVQRTSLATTTGGVETARVATSVRALSDSASRGLPPLWAQAVRGASVEQLEHVPDALDRSVATTDLGMSDGGGWWPAVRVVQWILICAVVVGLAWLFINVLFAGALPVPRWHSAPVPTLLVVGGVIAGLLLGFLSRRALEWTARHRRSRAITVLNYSVAQVADQMVVGSIAAELDRHAQACAAVAAAAARQ